MNKATISKAVIAILVGVSSLLPVAVAGTNGAFEAQPVKRIDDQVSTTIPVQEKWAVENVIKETKANEGVITLPTVVIIGERVASLPVKKNTCKNADEGTRPLTQGSGTVRTWTFCGK